MKQANAVVDRGSTLVVHPTPGLGDATTIADAIAMLPAGGGSLLLREGTFSLTVTVTLPDKPVVIKGCGDDTIIDLGANAIAAFTVPTLTAVRNYLFEDFLVTGTSIVGQEIWSIGDPASRGVINGKRINSSGVKDPVLITAGSGAPGFEPVTIQLDDCHLQPIAAGTSILINTTPLIGITANVYLQRIRFYDVFLDTIAGAFSGGGDFVDFTGVNILGEDCLFAIGSTGTLGALNLTNSTIFNFTGGPNPIIATGDDNNGVIPSCLVGCEAQFINFDIAGNGIDFIGGHYRACAFTDGAVSKFQDCFMFTNPPGAAAVIVGTGDTFVGNCRFDNAGTSFVLDGNFQTIEGNFFDGAPGTAIIRLTNGSANIYGNRFGGASTPILEVTSSTNVLSGNFYNGPEPSLLATTQTLPETFHGVPTKGTMFAQTASQTIANSVVETTLFSTGIGTLTLPPNWLIPGRTIHIRLYGIVSDTGNPTNIVNVKIGGTTVATTGTVTFSGTLANNSFFVDVIITCRTTGVAGTVFVQGKFDVEPGNFEGMPNTTTATIDTTVSQVLDVTFTWGTANASNTITNTNGTVEAL